MSSIGISAGSSMSLVKNCFAAKSELRTDLESLFRCIDALTPELINKDYRSKKKEFWTLSFFGENKDTFDNSELLGKFVRSYLCIPASSTPAERLFSSAQFQEEGRENLHTETLRKLTFIRSKIVMENMSIKNAVTLAAKVKK